MHKHRLGNYFEDFHLGQKFIHGTPRTITDGDTSLYTALTGTRHSISSASTVALALGYPKKPIHDLLAFNIAFGRTAPDISLNAIANLGYADVRFCQPLYPGDTIRGESTIIGLKQNSDGQSGNVYVRSVIYNQDEIEALSWVRWVMIKKKNLDIPEKGAVIPALPKHVPPEHLHLPQTLDTRNYNCWFTGGNRLWDDYKVGERLICAQGMTLDESDHTFATRLYQNPATVHFDAEVMARTKFERRLIYGGHVISVCHALSYDGLENVLFIAAINSGTHCNPTFAGDTLYVAHEVLEQWELPMRRDVGALRLRMIGTKNTPLTDIDDSFKQQKNNYHPNIVLDLDYTVILPRYPLPEAA